MPTFRISTEVKLRGSIDIDAESLDAANDRVIDEGITLIDADFFAGAEIVDWDYGEATEL